MNRWTRPALLSLCFAVFAVLLLTENWSPVRAVSYAVVWAVVTGLVGFAEYRRVH